MKSMAVMVVYSVDRRWDWTRLSVSSFREHFPDQPLLVVDHNNNATEREFLLSSGALLLNNSGPNTHGGGLDLACSWCIENNYPVMVHFEPDCFITSCHWYDNLIKAIDDGNEMAAVARVPFGPLHPCPSAWLCETIRYTFDTISCVEDALTEDYSKLIPPLKMQKWLNSPEGRKEDWVNFWGKLWDTGLKNWYEAALRGKAAQVNGNGIRHYWYGRRRGPENHLEFLPLL